MRVRSWGSAVGVLVCLSLPACFPPGEPGAAGVLDFEGLHGLCLYCPTPRGIALGARVTLTVYDRDCDGAAGAFTASVGAPFRVVSVGEVSHEDSYCSAPVTLVAEAEGSTSLVATSPSGRTDDYSIYVAEPAQLTLAELGFWWSRAESRRSTAEQDGGWRLEARLTDASRRELFYEESELVWTVDDESVLARQDIGGRVIFVGGELGLTTVRVALGELTAEVEVEVVPAL